MSFSSQQPPDAESGFTFASPTPTNGIEKNLTALDVLRGFALLGLLVTAIWEFGGFGPATQNFYRTGPHGGNYKLLTAVSVLFEGKMMALLALVFGAGIILFMQQQQKGEISR